jgi:hypothetical protein
MRTRIYTYRTVGLLSAFLALALTIPGCGDSGSDSRLEVLSFNLDRINGAFVNERLIFTFSAPVDPDSININTLQIRYDASMIDIDGDCFPDNPGNNNAVPDGDFLVDGNRVIFQPRIPSTPENNDVGLYPSHKIASNPSTSNCIRDTDLTMTYSVFIPGLSPEYPSVIRSARDGKPVQASYNSFFTTLEDLSFPPDIAISSFIDLGPGAPMFDRLDSPLEGATDVPLATSVRVRFTEPLLPSTVTRDSIFMVAVGPNNGREEIVPCEIQFDQIESTIILRPLITLPADVVVKVKFTEDLLDFGLNALEIPEGFEFPSFRTVSAPVKGPYFFREEFNTNDREDADETSALWNDPTLPGILGAGPGGGTAFDGELILNPGSPTVYEFDTGSYDPANPIPSFDYSRIQIGVRATVRAKGENPLILKSTSDILVQGVIDASGEDGGLVTNVSVIGGLGGDSGAGGGRGGDGGSEEGDDGIDGEGPRIPGTANDRHPGGGGGSVALLCASGGETGGGGGGEYGGGASAGTGDDGGGVGGAAGSIYGNADLNPFGNRLVGGSGGGSAGATCFDGIVYPGAGGGGGGGAIWLHAAGNITIAGSVVADGGDGGSNQYANANRGGAAGGAGSGGGILLQAVEDFTNETASSVSANRGIGGVASEAGAPNGRGGNGGRGRIRIEASAFDIEPLNFNPAPSQGGYLIDGQTSVGTSQWIDTGAFFADYSYSRQGGQDNRNSFPNPDTVIEYWFQGAPPDPADPSQPDLDNLRPGIGEFTQNIDEIDDTRFIRVKVVFNRPRPDNGLIPQVLFYEFGFTFAGGIPRN